MGGIYSAKDAHGLPLAPTQLKAHAQTQAQAQTTHEEKTSLQRLDLEREITAACFYQPGKPLLTKNEFLMHRCFIFLPLFLLALIGAIMFNFNMVLVSWVIDASVIILCTFDLIKRRGWQSHLLNQRG